MALCSELNPATISALRDVGTLYNVPKPREVPVGPRECGVWFRNWDANRDFSKQLTKQVRKGVGNARFLREARAFDTSFGATHANAVISNRGGDGDWRNTVMAREWRKNGLPGLAEYVRHQHETGPVILGGDLNAADRGSANPRHFFQRLGMNSVCREVMWLGWTNEYRAVKVQSKNRVPGADDHPVLLVTLERRS